MTFIPPRFQLAPMEGVVDWVIRDIATTIGGIDGCVTEFVRVTDRLLPDHEFFKYAPELRYGSRTRAGVPVLLQLLGGQPEPMAQNAVRAIALGAHGIDLNFGCPAKTVNRHDGGAALLRNPDRVFTVTSSVRSAVDPLKSVSAKVRLGFSDKTLFMEIGKAAEEAGAAWLTVHARTRDEGYRPPAHWEYIRLLGEGLKIPVIANGEIWTIEDFRKCREVSGCTSFMAGRGLMSNPFLGLEVQAELTGHTAAAIDTSWARMAPWLPVFMQMSHDFRSDRYAVGRTKQWTRALSRHYPEAETLFHSLKLLEDYAPMRGLILNELERLYRVDRSFIPARSGISQNANDVLT